MPGTKSRLTALEARKNLLLIESELNRIRFRHEWQQLAAETTELAQHAQSLCAKVSSFASLGIAGFQAVRDMRAARPKGKSSWLATVLQGLRVGTSLWTSLRSQSR